MPAKPAPRLPSNGKPIPIVSSARATGSGNRRIPVNPSSASVARPSKGPGATQAPANGGASARSGAGSAAAGAAKSEAKILFQKYFKSVGPRTYAAQVKEAGNGNHFLVVTEGKRDESSGEVRKTKVFVFSEDFRDFFRMLHETAQFIKANPVPEEVRHRRERHWARKAEQTEKPASAAARTPMAASPPSAARRNPPRK